MDLGASTPSTSAARIQIVTYIPPPRHHLSSCQVIRTRRLRVGCCPLLPLATASPLRSACRLLPTLSYARRGHSLLCVLVLGMDRSVSAPRQKYKANIKHASSRPCPNPIELRRSPKHPGLLKPLSAATQIKAPSFESRKVRSIHSSIQRGTGRPCGLVCLWPLRLLALEAGKTLSSIRVVARWGRPSNRSTFAALLENRSMRASK